ncbi:MULTISPECIES: Xaa-Pro aminopeptidase [Pseudoalteromonas]|uniref:Xaa-Pro aminopeptidase n=2 Tax=Pseudoalteromonas TaxID=53246 RepID=A0A0F4PHA5_9GAMM|nr:MULTISPECIES: Xaa-Pro aminopeptidase [Pseudoalteromonas]KJY94479.1 proline aminopeptidase P II [Pseudoalteromonas ruthenica]KJY95510.1 proline aminopeptidase P II [Pseudoalteromonas ruthenica]MCG7567057.1 Xaa-Pro aminopeptidase [Pseudoalteromonas sp. CnMc7-15]TMO84517.1 Xaa-Pro aminopeptidase [Pseudoalteromonas ruthenica]TMO92370.1 Xaa-Pro aminopeptidase [Pseudoalteromonas ruthenica]|tara:strand:- start:12412 stop:13722 length:1311 start_codon:yes stop_codon:yes gene_type:complete
MTISKNEYLMRQQRLLAQMKTNSVALIPAAKEITRSRDTEFPFRQDSDFFYLTGFNEPDAMLVLVNGEQQKSILYCRAKDKSAEIWHGRRLGADAAKQQLPVDEAYTLAELEQGLLDAVNQKSTLYYGQGVYSDVDNQVLALLNTLRGAPKKGYRAPEVIRDIRTLVHEMRLFKSDAEIAIMRRAAKISAEAHERAMRFAKPGATEYQLEAELHHHYAMNGARHPAYGTIVGSGDNATILHYTENESTLKDGDLILIDSGCELDGYAADITRTFPVNGRFNAAQKALYQVVLDAQLAALEVVKPGNTLAQAAKVVNRMLTEGLVKLGLLEGNVDELVESQAFRAFYMHGLGHWLGLDVHDVGEYKKDEQDREFAPGMVLTIEPGLYIAEDAPVAEQYRGIGIRIEDDVLVTEKGHENLSASVPKDIAAIEALMQES